MKGVPGKAVGGKGSGGDWEGWGRTVGLLPYLLFLPRVAMAEAEEGGAAVELSGLPPDVPDELLTLYFENHRRSGGGPVLSWQRLGCGGVLTFQEAAGEGADGKGSLGTTGHQP